jgi:hypothetical protein
VELVGEVENNLGEVQRPSSQPPWKVRAKNGAKSMMWRMHVVYICISVLMNYDCTTHPILPFITINTKFLSKHLIKRVLDTEMNWLSLFQFYRKTFLRSVDPKQPKDVKFSLRSIIETFPRGGVWLSGKVQKFSGEVQNNPRGGARLHTPAFKIRPWQKPFRSL